MLNAAGIRIHCKYFAPFAKQMDQISSVSAAGVEYPHARGDVSSQNLIEYININMAELLLNL
jgi:hypothetical protein